MDQALAPGLEAHDLDQLTPAQVIQRARAARRHCVKTAALDDARARARQRTAEVRQLEKELLMLRRVLAILGPRIREAETARDCSQANAQDLADRVERLRIKVVGLCGVARLDPVATLGDL